MPQQKAKVSITYDLPYTFHGLKTQLLCTWLPSERKLVAYVPLPNLAKGTSKLFDYLHNSNQGALAYLNIYYKKSKHHLHLSKFYVETQHRKETTADEAKSLKGLGKTILCKSILFLDKQIQASKDIKRKGLTIWLEASGGDYAGILPTSKDQIISDAHDVISTMGLTSKQLSDAKSVTSLAKTILATMPDTWEILEEEEVEEEEYLQELYDIIGNFRLMRYYERMYSFKIDGKITDGTGIPMVVDYSKILETCKKNA